LCRIGYELIEYILETYSNTKIIIENKRNESKEESVITDLMQNITAYGTRMNGIRSYRTSKKVTLGKK
jgi:predicted site-specific integrase-resolvase